MFQAPPEIVASGTCGASITFEWDIDVSDNMIYPPEDRFPRLAKAYWLCDLRAGYALALATAEWAVWRFDGIVDIGDAALRLEAAYAAEIDARYAVLPEPDEPFPDTLQDAHGPLKLARMLISRAHACFLAGDDSVHAVGFSTALLALHVCARAPALEDWLERSLRRANALHPPSSEPLAAQQPVGRSFFLGLRPASDGDAEGWRDFLATLDSARNPYLRTPAAMNELGFLAPSRRID